MPILFIYYSYCVLLFYFSILGLIFIGECLAVVFSTKSGFISSRFSYLDYPLVGYFSNLDFSFIFYLIITVIKLYM